MICISAFVLVTYAVVVAWRGESDFMLQLRIPLAKWKIHFPRTIYGKKPSGWTLHIIVCWKRWSHNRIPTKLVGFLQWNVKILLALKSFQKRKAKTFTCKCLRPWDGIILQQWHNFACFYGLEKYLTRSAMFITLTSTSPNIGNVSFKF